MDEKSDTRNRGFEEAHLAQTRSSNNGRRRGLSAYFKDLTICRFCYAVCLTLTAWFILHTVETSYQRSHLPATRSYVPVAETILAEQNATKVALEAHVMSKCPDAKACLEMLVVPAMEQISGKVDFRLSYIGRYVKYSQTTSTCAEQCPLTEGGYAVLTLTLTPYPACTALPNALAISSSSAPRIFTRPPNSTSASPTA
jgi:hypothetical protein